MFMFVLRVGCCQPSAHWPWWCGSAWHLTALRPSRRDWPSWLASPSSQVGVHDRSKCADCARSALHKFLWHPNSGLGLGPTLDFVIAVNPRWVKPAKNRGRRGEQSCVCDYRCFRSIIVTAFMGTSVIFICFTLSALYAKRRSYLFLGGKGQRVSEWSSDCSCLMLSHCCLQVPWCLASLCSSSCQSLTCSSAPLFSSRYSSASIWHTWHAQQTWQVAPLTTCTFFVGHRVLPGPHVSGAAHHVRLRPVWHSAHYRKSRKWGQRLRVVSLDWWTLDYSLHINVICSRSRCRAISTSSSSSLRMRRM